MTRKIQVFNCSMQQFTVLMIENGITVLIDLNIKFNLHQNILVRTQLINEDKRHIIERICYVSAIVKKTISIDLHQTQLITLIPFHYMLPGHSMISK